MKRCRMDQDLRPENSTILCLHYIAAQIQLSFPSILSFQHSPSLLLTVFSPSHSLLNHTFSIPQSIMLNFNPLFALLDFPSSRSSSPRQLLRPYFCPPGLTLPAFTGPAACQLWFLGSPSIPARAEMGPRETLVFSRKDGELSFMIFILPSPNTVVDLPHGMRC